MGWLFIAAVTIGLPLAVPPVVRALDGVPEPEGDVLASVVGTFAGIGLTVFGAIGLLAIGFSAETPVALVAAGALGVAAGALHPDLLDWLGRRGAGAETGGPNAESDV